MAERILSQIVRACREARNMTQADLGAAMGVTQEAVSMLESGQRPMSERTLERVAAAFGLTESALLDEGLRAAIKGPSR